MIEPPEKYFGFLQVLKYQGKPIFVTTGSSTIKQVQKALQRMTGNTYEIEQRKAPPELAYGGVSIWGVEWPEGFRTSVTAKMAGQSITWGWVKEPGAAKVVAAALQKMGLTFGGKKIPWTAFEASRW